MIIKAPQIKKIKQNDDTVTSVVQIFENEYNDEDLELDFLVPVDEDGFMEVDDSDAEGVPFEEASDDDDWLSMLDD